MHIAQHYPIVAGPSKDELSSALFQGDNQHRQPLTFYIEDPDCKRPTPQSLILQKVARSFDGEDEKWEFDGRLYAIGERKPGIPTRGSYSTRTYRGELEF